MLCNCSSCSSSDKSTEKIDSSASIPETPSYSYSRPTQEIQETIWGVTVGGTTIESAIATLTRRGCNLEYVGKNQYMAYGIFGFAGIDWDVIAVTTDQDIVVNLWFSKLYHSKKSFNKSYNELSEALKSKYDKLPSQELEGVNGFSISDGTTSVILGGSPVSGGGITLNLIYQTMKKIIRIGYDSNGI